MASQPTVQDTYEQQRAALDALRHAMLADRLTFSVVQSRLREAAMEQAEDQVTYLGEREESLQSLLVTRERRVAELTAEVGQLRIHTLAGVLEQTVTDLTAAVRSIEAQIQQLCADLPEALALAERAQGYASGLPATYLRERVATNETVERLRAMDELMRLLCYLLGAGK